MMRQGRQRLQIIYKQKFRHLEVEIHSYSLLGPMPLCRSLSIEEQSLDATDDYKVEPLKNAKGLTSFENMDVEENGMGST